ncbi:MAG: carbon-nitrogen hydrolase family protein [Myxococcales bacterium FL481]|nr:MAG: carbon-nitrogen hydrolase family protein [Myxococcales bacterium FL481]
MVRVAGHRRGCTWICGTGLHWGRPGCATSRCSFSPCGRPGSFASRRVTPSHRACGCGRSCATRGRCHPLGRRCATPAARWCASGSRRWERAVVGRDSLARPHGDGQRAVRREPGASSHASCFAVAQLEVLAANVAANVSRHEPLIRAAVEAGADLVVFPELSLTGYELGDAVRLAILPDDGCLDPLRTLAAIHDITVVVGAPLHRNRELFLGALALGPSGSIALYTKHHLGAFSPEASPSGPIPPPEWSVFSPGAANPLIRCGESRAGLAICADINHREHVARAAARGAGLYLAGVFSIPSDVDNDHRTLAAYARDLGLAVGFANYCGRTGGLWSGGRSAIWSPTGECLGELPACGPGLVIARRGPGVWHGEVVRVS